MAITSNFSILFISWKKMEKRFPQNLTPSKVNLCFVDASPDELIDIVFEEHLKMKLTLRRSFQEKFSILPPRMTSINFPLIRFKMQCK